MCLLVNCSVVSQAKPAVVSYRCVVSRPPASVYTDSTFPTTFH